MSDPRELHLIGPDRLHEEVSRLLSHYRDAKRPPVSMVSPHWHPLVDVFETEDAIYVMAELAGVHEDQVRLIADGSSLMLTGNRPTCGPSGQRQYLQMEIPVGPFERRIDLPSYADVEGAQATYDNGFLEVMVPKRTQRSRHNVTIRIQQAD